MLAEYIYLAAVEELARLGHLLEVDGVQLSQLLICQHRHTTSQNWQIRVRNNTPWLLFFHSFSLFSLWIFRSLSRIH